ncbi:Sugar transferase involved in LPS biosynthesis (colanic, teichoic acid) [Parafrankia irregularis]|uniref:Sugar transferase involved in LPS biosynthesis (Colanic, teichoic acid) n=2 Tax=Frankiaceae TaxID=74712 RepID=A0A0S4QEA0_9ACTN|nr:Sugar transferase involved in LPS biosynthesis (colanic, teichoic acid) [Parafrankia irregularis]
MPVLTFAAAAIKVDDGGPVLFRQERVGVAGEPFTMLKLRTMTVGTEQAGLGLLAGRNDPRTTRVGRVLRRASIDELPQLFNVLAGQMSLVGPRPTVRSQVDRYSARQMGRLRAHPGIAGWAQVNGRNQICWDRRIELDLWYIDNWSLRLDLVILWRALLTAVAGAGTYGADGVTQDFGSCQGEGGCRCGQAAGSHPRRRRGHPRTVAPLSADRTGDGQHPPPRVLAGGVA